MLQSSIGLLPLLFLRFIILLQKIHLKKCILFRLISRLYLSSAFLDPLFVLSLDRFDLSLVFSFFFKHLHLVVLLYVFRVILQVLQCQVIVLFQLFVSSFQLSYLNLLELYLLHMNSHLFLATRFHIVHLINRFLISYLELFILIAQFPVPLFTLLQLRFEILNSCLRLLRNLSNLQPFYESLPLILKFNLETFQLVFCTIQILLQLAISNLKLRVPFLCSTK